ncbi:hypothetical protein AB0O95_02470 [Rhodoglobus sp. NPDC076762]
MQKLNAERARPRDVVAAITLWGPLIVTVTTGALWFPDLPGELPRQWNSAGVSSTWPTWLAFTVLVVISLGSALIAAFALHEDAADRRRKTFLWSGFAAGLASGAWLLVSGSTITSSDSAAPQVGAWPVVLILSMGYGVLPFLIAHRWVDPAQQVSRPNQS